MGAKYYLQYTYSYKTQQKTKTVKKLFVQGSINCGDDHAP